MSAVSAVEIGSLGNSETRARTKEVKRYCFTHNNYSEEDCKIIEQSAEKYKYLYIFGYEVGDQGTPHLQGYIEWPNKTAYTAIIKKLGIQMHFTPAKGNRNDNINYCSKDGNYKSNIPECKPKKPLKLITNLYPWQKEIVDLHETEPDGKTVHWYVDLKGLQGKSSFSKYMAYHHKVLVIQGGAFKDIMNIIFNWDMDTTTMMIIDIPRKNGNSISIAALECIFNGMITNTKFETGVKMFNPPHIIVFSNFYPNESDLSEGRWNIKKL